MSLKTNAEAFMIFLHRERRAVLILAVGCLALGSLDRLAYAGLAFRAGNWESGWDDLCGAAFSFWMAWLAYRRPAKWGFRIGLLFLCVFAFVAVIGVPVVIWILRHHPEAEPFNLLRDVDWWGWTKFGLNTLGRLVLAGACLSLRWLYPEYRPSLRAEIERLERQKAAATRVATA